MSGAAAEGRDGEERGQLESALQGAQLESDRISLRLIQKLLAADRQARALEVSCTLHNMPALEGALKLANHHRCGRAGLQLLCCAGLLGWPAGIVGLLLHRAAQLTATALLCLALVQPMPSATLQSLPRLLAAAS
jgi:hypothetical protein